MTTMTRVSQLWDQIETWGFRKDIKDVKGIGLDDDNNKEEDKDKDDDNNKGNNDSKGISALGLDGDLEFSRGHQGYQRHPPHDDNNKENDDEVEDNNNKNDKAIERYLSSGKRQRSGVFVRSSGYRH